MIIDISKSFIERIPEKFISDDALLRIIESYTLSKKIQMEAKNCYQVGNEWRPIFNTHLGTYINALSTKNLPLIRAMFQNFFREELSAGLHGLHFDMVAKYMTPEHPIKADDLRLYMDALVSNFTLFARNFPDTSTEVLARESFGNAYGCHIDGHFIVAGAESHYFHAHKIKQLLDSKSKRRVLELGGGYGGMAYYLLRDAPMFKYISFDLPEQAALQAFYLFSNFPEKRIALYGEISSISTEADSYDALIMPNFEIENIPDNFIDLSFNSYSLAEMEIDAINNYITNICRFTSTYFYHLNHAVIAKLSSDAFPIDFKKFELLFRYPAMWGKFAGRNPTIDEHEYIYRVRPL